MKKHICLALLLVGFICGDAQSITPQTVMEKVKKGKPFTLVFLKAGKPEKENDKEIEKMQMDHLVHLFQMEKDGKISIFGPVMNDSTLKGIIIFNSTDPVQIKKELEADPFVKAGYLVYELHDWFSIPGQKIPE